AREARRVSSAPQRPLQRLTELHIPIAPRTRVEAVGAAGHVQHQVASRGAMAVHVERADVVGTRRMSDEAEGLSRGGCTVALLTFESTLQRAPVGGLGGGGQHNLGTDRGPERHGLPMWKLCDTPVSSSRYTWANVAYATLSGHGGVASHSGTRRVQPRAHSRGRNAPLRLR